jgi:DNA replication protein DnaC
MKNSLKLIDGVFKVPNARYNAENVVFLGPPNVGKSRLAVALGIEAVKSAVSQIRPHNKLFY